MASRPSETNTNSVSSTDRAAIGPQPDNTPATGGTSTGGGGGGTPTGPAGGDLTGTYPNPTLAAIGGAVGPVGDSTHVAAVTKDAKGRVTALSSIAIAFPSSLPPSGAAGGDLTGSYPNPTLAAIGSATGPIGDGTHVPVVTIDAKGRVTGLTSTPISGGGGGITSLSGSEFSITNPAGPATNIATGNITPPTAAVGPGAAINGGMKLVVAGTQGAPTNTGTTQTNGIARLGTNVSIVDIGSESVGDTWFQSYDASNLALHYKLKFNPLGGDVELGGTTGETKANSKAAGTGAVLRTLAQHWGNIFNVEDYGASSIASAATNQTAIQAAIDAAIAGKGAVYVPFSYDINDTFTTSGLAGPFAIIGNAPGVSGFRQTVANKGVISISNASTNLNACVSLLNFQCLNTSGTALSSTAAITVDFTTVTQWRGKNLSVQNLQFGFETSFKSFAYGLDLRHINEGSIFGVCFYGDNAAGGTAIRFRKTGSGATGPDNKCIVCFVTACNASNCGTFIEVNDAMETLAVANCLCGGCDYGLKLDYCIHVAVTNCHMPAGVSSIYGTGAGASPAINQLEVSNCDLYSSGVGTTVISGSFNQFNITGTTFYCAAGSGGKFIVLKGNGGNGIVTGNTFNCVDNAITTFVQIDSGCTGVRVTGNHFAGTPTNYYVNNGGATNRVGEGATFSGVTTPPGGTATHTVDIDISAARLGTLLNDVPVCVQSQAFIGAYSDPTDGAQTLTNLRVVFFRFDGGNLAATAFRYGATVQP